MFEHRYKMDSFGKFVFNRSYEIQIVDDDCKWFILLQCMQGIRIVACKKLEKCDLLWSFTWFNVQTQIIIPICFPVVKAYWCVSR